MFFSSTSVERVVDLWNELPLPGGSGRRFPGNVGCKDHRLRCTFIKTLAKYAIVEAKKRMTTPSALPKNAHLVGAAAQSTLVRIPC